MEIYEGIEIVDLCLFIKKHKTLVIGDLHLGFEESLNKQGVLIPRLQFAAVMKNLPKILEKTNPETVIITGDVKHEFGTISNQEWNNILKVFELIQKHSKELIVIKGNHDKILEPITEKRNIKILDEYKIGNVHFVHGDIIKDNLSEIIIMGHEHPAIKFAERPTQKYKCFIKGKYEDSILIVLPSFNIISEGTNIKDHRFLSPYLKKADIDNFEVYIIEDKPYYFGKLKDIE